MEEPARLQISLLPTLVLPIGKALEERGVDPEALYAKVGIDISVRGDPDRRIPRDKFHNLMRDAVLVTGDESFGLAAASHLRPQVLQALGLSCLASETVYEGLQRMSRFARFISTGLVMRLEEEGELLHAWLDGRLRPDDPVYAVRDYGVGMVVQMCRLTLGERLQPLLASVERPAPEDPTPWQQLLGLGVRFDNSVEGTRLTWRLTDVQEQLATGDPMLARVTADRAQDYLDRLDGKSIARKVADRIVKLLPDGAPGQADVAAAMHMSSRTLQRRLREEGTTFAQILKDVRMELARAHLCDQNRSVLETAYLLGFSEPSTFSRAFKNWTGRSPADFRQSKQAA